MKKINFSIQINAPKAHVWNTLWDDATYRKWTVVFHEGSYAESDWKEGSPIKFLGPGGDGMSSRIARLIPNEFMSFEHLGEIKDGVESVDRTWSGAHENYSLHEKDGGTELVTEMDSDESFESYFLDTIPKALELVKQLAERQSITPFLWFDQEAEDATLFYTSLFPNSKVNSIMRNGDVIFTTGFTLAGQSFAALNGGPMYKINPSISFYTICESEDEIETLWEKLIDGGSALMPLDTYPWSPKYGWLQDRYGLNWQLTLGKVAEMGQKITPSLMFTGAQHGKAETAINFYSSIFKHPYTKLLSRYAAGGLDPEGTINHAQFSLGGQMFIVMDSAHPHAFQFNEALSFVIHCDTQAEIDYYWEKLTSNGGEEGQCGWLKDQFGVSWQVVPVNLGALLGDEDPAKAQRAMQAMMQMKKLNIEALKGA
jgi:predicted 3-demethylubiquinone-9 3-methyltransferase (glyoxalase superfamily)/uncharacterized protein YndB with AHSA1/START domain